MGAVMKGVPEEQSWVQVKEKLKAKLPEGAALWFVSEVNDKNQCFVVTSPFDNDIKFYETMELDLGNAKVKAELCSGDLSAAGAEALAEAHQGEAREGVS